MFPSSTKREFRHFHVVVVQRRQRNVSKSVLHVQSCCFVDLNLLLFCRSRCRRRGRCLSSLGASASSCALLPGASRHPRLRLETELRVWARIWSLGDNLSPWLKFWGTFSFLGGQIFVHPSFLAGLLIGLERKSQISRIFRDKFAEKSADFAGVFGANFTEKQSVKNGRFCGYFQGKFR